MGRYLELAKQVTPRQPTALFPSTDSKRAVWPVRCTLCGEVLSGLREGVDHVRAVHAGDGKSSQKDTPETLAMDFSKPDGNSVPKSPGEDFRAPSGTREGK
jgi:hypothetical protein